MFNAMSMKSILMFDFKNDHDLIGIHLSLDVCSRQQRSNKDFDYDLGKVNAYGKLKLMNVLNVQHSNDWGWINPYEEEFLFDGHMLEIFMKNGISVYGTLNFWIGFYLCRM